MYKKILFMALIMSQWALVNSQTISRKSISSAGSTLTGGSFMITFNIGETVIPTLSAGGTIITEGFEQPGEQIITGIIPAAACVGTVVNVPFTATDLLATNTYTAQLSNATGSFASPINIGTLAGNTNAGTIAATIPVNTPGGNGYKIRVVGSVPLTIGTSSANITLNPLPIVAIIGLAAAYCQNEPAFVLIGTPSGAGGIFKIDGVTSTQFNPEQWSVGSHTVVFTYTDGNGCTNSTSQTVTVKAITPVSITGLNASYCKTATPVTLTATPSGGTFYIDGIVAPVLNPSVLSNGNHVVSYIFTNAAGCTTSAVQTVFTGSQGNLIPDANFAAAIRSSCPTCIDDCNYLLPPSATLQTLSVGGKNIRSLAGIEDFVSLRELYCEANNLTTLPNNLPTNLQSLYCYSNQLTALPNNLPPNLATLFCHNNRLTALPIKLPANLSDLRCYNNNLRSLPSNLPSGLFTLHCFNNELTALPNNLPVGLQYLYCEGNNITCLPTLPNLFVLRLDADRISCLPQAMRLVRNANNQTVNLPICTTPCAAPVSRRLGNFRGTTITNTNALIWQTGTLTNAANFDVERSEDGVNFEKIGEIKAQKGVSAYQFDDKTPLSNQNHYRLKINELEGQTDFSNTIVLQSGKIFRGLKIYPNPVSTTLNIEVENNSDFQIFNLVGQEVMRGKTATQQPIEVSHFPKGAYILKIGTEQRKFVKQ